MTKEIYNIQRQKLMDDAQKLLDESKTAEAQAKMKEVEALDAKFEEEAKIQANLNALAGQKVAAPAAAAQSVDLSGTAKTPDVLDRYDTDEYKRAFMNYVLTGKKIPAELTNTDANTKTSDVGAAIPTTTLQKIYEKIEATGMILPRVTHTSYKGGVTVPTSSAKPTASWVAEGAGSDKQKKALGSITFAYHKLRCAISMSLEVSIVTYPMFESQFVANVAEAMVKAEEQAIISGSGSGQPMGITNYQFVAGATLILPSCECNTQAQKNAAFLLASYLTAPKQQLEWATVSSYYVTRKSASTDPQYAEAYQALLDKLPETSVIDLNSYVSKTKHPLFDKCGDVFENYMSEIMNNGMDPEEGWEMMVEEINDTLADA